MLWKITKKFNFAADTVIPDSLVFCLVLTFITFLASMLATGTGFMDMLGLYYAGFFGSLFTFGFQMGLIILFAGTAAKAPVFERLLSKMARKLHTTTGALLFMLVFAAIASWINWAFGLILTPILSVQLCKNVKGLHFPVMVAAGYGMMIMVQPLSLSTPVVNLMATPGHFLEDITGVVPASQTAFNPVLLITYACLFVATVLMVIFTRPPEKEIIGLESAEFVSLDEKPAPAVDKSSWTPADKMNNSRILSLILSAICTIYVVYYFATNGINMTTNFIIFLFFTLCTWVYPSPIGLMQAIAGNIGSIPQTIVQFPMYGAIMQMMSGSGLTTIVANGLISVASIRTLPLLTYLSASFVNLFVPSQGGQWAIQGPVVTQAAKVLGAHQGIIADAFMLGDEGTNLLQPFYVIPALSVLGMKLKDIYGYMMFMWVIWFIITCICLYVLPGILI